MVRLVMLCILPLVSPPSSRKVSSAVMHCVEEELVGFSRDDLINLKMKILDQNTILKAPSWIDSTRRGFKSTRFWNL